MKNYGLNFCDCTVSKFAFSCHFEMLTVSLFRTGNYRECQNCVKSTVSIIDTQIVLPEGSDNGESMIDAAELKQQSVWLKLVASFTYQEMAILHGMLSIRL